MNQGTSSGPVTALAPAKINLALHVTGQRDDGFHLLETLVVFAAFGDRLKISSAESDGFTISGPYSRSLAADEGNLVVRARDLLRENLSVAQAFPVSIELEKNLPVASGIGGGSSDAAATLQTLSSVWQAGLDAGALARIGRSLGADVPMCLTGAPLIARGTGEILEPVGGFSPAVAPARQSGRGGFDLRCVRQAWGEAKRANAALAGRAVTGKPAGLACVFPQ